MQIYYVRPAREEGYGRGDGTSYEHAWNGFDAVQWDKLAGDPPGTLWVCGSPQGPQGFLTLHVELSYLHPQRESATQPESAGPLGLVLSS